MTDDIFNTYQTYEIIIASLLKKNGGAMIIEVDSSLVEGGILFKVSGEIDKRVIELKLIEYTNKVMN